MHACAIATRSLHADSSTPVAPQSRTSARKLIQDKHSHSPSRDPRVHYFDLGGSTTSSTSPSKIPSSDSGVLSGCLPLDIVDIMPIDV